MKNFKVEAIITSYGILNMKGGTISENTITRATVFNSNIFNMSGGTISDEVGIENYDSVIISDSAYIKQINLKNMFSNLTLGGNLSIESPILVTMNQYINGQTVLKGQQEILLANYEKFVLEDTVNYKILYDGTIEYTVPTKEYYVNGLVGDDSNIGDSAAPFKTIQKAAAEIVQNEVGVIILQSDIELTDFIVPVIVYLP